MQYFDQFLFWLFIVFATLVTIKGLIILFAKRAVYPGDIFKEIEVTNVRKYNMLNGSMHIGLGILFAVVAIMFRYTNSFAFVFLICTGIGIAGNKLEKLVESNYLVQHG